MFAFLRPLLIPALIALPPVPAAAQAVPDDLLRAEILDGWRTGSGTRMVALHITLAKGWKTYWRAPGEAGVPPRFDWTGSRNLAGVTVHWPSPEVFDLNGFTTFGYSGELVLPMELRMTDPAAPTSLSASIDLGVCEEICVPVSFDIAAEVSGDGGHVQAIDAALSRRPGPARAAGLTAISCALEPIADGLRLRAEIAMPSLGGHELAVVELSDPSVWVAPAELTRDGGALSLVTEIVPPDASPFALNRGDLRFTFFGGGRVVETLGCTG